MVNKTYTLEQPKKYTFKTEPFTHQKKVLQESWLRPYFALFLEMGAGKTKIIIDNAGALYINDMIDGLLIIAPNGVYRNWTTKEIPQHMSDGVEYNMMYWVPASKQRKKYKAELETFLEGSDKLDIFCVSIDCLNTEAGLNACKKFLTTHTAMTVVDESTRIKTHNAQRTKNATILAKMSKYRRILTGSPITKNPLDLYGQCNFLSPAIMQPKQGIFKDNPLGFCNYSSFRARYAVMREATSAGGRGIQFPAYFINQDELARKLKEFSVRLTKKECLDLPEKIYQERYVELTDEQALHYKTMQSEAKVIVEACQNGEITAKNALTKLLRLQQVSCGFITGDNGLPIRIKNNRLNELSTLCDEIDLCQSKVIIWSNFVCCIEDIVDMLKKKYGEDSVVHFYGKTTAEEREYTKEAFQDKNSPVKFLVANPSSAGMGLTLTEAKTVIYYSNDYNLEYRMQSEDRAHRAGQTDNVLYIDMVSTPMDIKVIKALRNKKDVADMILDGTILDD